jgi:hypothetical protein
VEGCTRGAVGLQLGPVAPPVLLQASAKPRLTAEERATVDLFQKSTPSVVYITNLAVRCVLIGWRMRQLTVESAFLYHCFKTL